MKFDPQKHHRRSIRLKGYDYTQPGAYFVTMCTWHRETLLGDIIGGEMRLSAMGQIIEIEWRRLTDHFNHLELGAFVIMPNHVHGILILSTGEASAQIVSYPAEIRWADASPQPPIGTQPGSLGAILQNLKSVSTRKINQLQCTPGAPVWQRNYYEHIIRDEADWRRIAAYIQNNPARWTDDQLHPQASPDRFPKK